MQSFQSSFKLAQAPSASKVSVTFDLRNTHPTQTYYVCHYHTPLESLMGSGAVEVTHVDSRTVLPYRGKKCKRVAPQPSSYLKVDPGCTISNTIEISKGYRFDRGRYRVSSCKQVSTRLDPNDETTGQIVDLECEPLEFTISIFQ